VALAAELPHPRTWPVNGQTTSELKEFETVFGGPISGVSPPLQ